MAKKKRGKCKKCKKSKKLMGKNTEMTSEQFLVGLLIGGGAAYVLSDETLRGQVIRYAMQTFGSVAQSVEELKEQFADIRAEIVAEQAVQA
ncbi:MAG: YtxH domain-containing protein [Proteobacteria bacterium]|nr:YtxH domain-containing protein [Pseudomonadota bacterium]